MTYQKNNPQKGSRLLIAGLVCIVLAVSGVLLRAKSADMRKNNQSSQQVLNHTLPDFSIQGASALRQELKSSKDRLLGLSALFDPKYQWVKKDYDLTIYFVEELGSVKQLLKNKANQKQVDCPDLGFKENLPAESEAAYLLSELYGLREIVSLGMDRGVNFKKIAPQGAQDYAQIPGVKLVKTNLTLSCPAQSLIEFILQLNEVVPKVCFDSLSLKSQGDSFDVNLAVEHIVIETNLYDKQELQALPEIKEVVRKEDRDFIHTLRSNSPFFIPQAKELLGSAQAGKPQEAKQAIRFVYRGRAILKSKQVAVIEDALKQETVFVGLNEKIGGFILLNISDERITLKDNGNNKELIIKREEK